MAKVGPPSLEPYEDMRLKVGLFLGLECSLYFLHSSPFLFLSVHVKLPKLKGVNQIHGAVEALVNYMKNVSG